MSRPEAKPPLILDSWSVLAFLQGEPGGAAVAELIATAFADETPVLMSVINAGETWYILARALSPKEADRALHDIEELHVQWIDVNWAMAKAAAAYKALYKMSYADAIAAALAKKRSGVLLTGDPEFKPLQKEVSIRWLTAT